MPSANARLLATFDAVVDGRAAGELGGGDQGTQGMLEGLKQLARRHAPVVVRQFWVNHKARRLGRGGDLQSIFSDIYEHGRWGGSGRSGDRYDSGEGSGGAAADAFVSVVNDLIATEGLTSLVDIGCGDFRIGQRIARPGLDYTGVEIFPALVTQNTQRYGRPGVRFICADATRNELPAADACLIREVLQHLSNADIAAIFKQLPRYRFAVIAECHPAPARLKRANMDKSSGCGTRVVFDSAVDPAAPPFSLPGVRVANRSPAPFCHFPGEEIVTYLVRSSA